MSQFVAGNRLRTHIASGTFGVGGTALSAGGEINIPHGFPPDGPTAFGITLSTSNLTGLSQLNRAAYARISGTMLVGLVISAINTACASVTCVGVWWAKM